jgi:hypothetical protein
MTGGQLSNVEAVHKFVLAGLARFTLVSKRTGERFTFCVVKGPRVLMDDQPYFVKVLTGPDRYVFLGTLFEAPYDRGTTYRHGTKSKISETASSAKAFKWFWRHLVSGKSLERCEFWHEGKCGKCGRALTVPESIASGLGPVCGAA